MVSFVVGGPAWDMEIREPLFREFVGLVAIEKCKPGIWVLHFVDKESATAAQWQLDLNGAHGITREEKKMGWNEFVEYLWSDKFLNGLLHSLGIHVHEYAVLADHPADWNFNHGMCQF